MSLAAPGAAFAAPSPTPTVGPQRAPAVSLSPSPSASPAVVAASPSAVAAVSSPLPLGVDKTARSAGEGGVLAAIAPSPQTPQPTPTATPTPSTEAESDGDSPDEEVDWRAFVPTDTADHLATMDRAARQSGCGVPWQLLAAIARVESDFGRNMATSSAGAIGYGQFLPTSWQAFGSDGNAYDYRDALPAIAQYLCRAGLARDPRRALFAYNHADWYVDLVLDLAVRYDRMAPGAPVPEVLGVGPATEAVHPLHYAVATQAPLWLTVPWRGRRAGEPISPASLAATTLDMLRGTFGVSGGLPDDAIPESSELGELVNRAWPAGLLALPEQGAEWTVDGIRLHLQRGQPVVALVDGAALPGHAASDGSGDQPVVVIGATADGLIYADPSFSSSLGYGLELADADFLASWRAAALPRRALAFTSRPRPPARQAHLNEAEPPPAIPRLTATPHPTPTLAPSPSPLPTEQAATPSAVPAVLQASVAVPPPRTDDQADSTWVILAAAGALLPVTFVFRRRRAHR